MGSKRILQGTVVSNKMDKTVVVAVERRQHLEPLALEVVREHLHQRPLVL
ncbi:MAG: 30S ribosomal protein S17, partial [Chloroflexota bacterium]